MAPHPRTILALCPGVGGLELAVHDVFPGARVVGACERQAFCASTLVARMEAKELHPFPIWDDLATFDGRPWRGKVDLITAGYPCQPDSVAGERLGAEDERWLWPEVTRCVREVRPRFAFFENVTGHVAGTFDRVLCDLAALGFDAEWDVVGACCVGAPHKRERVFILAAHTNGYQLRTKQGWREPRGSGAPVPRDDGAHGTAADSNSTGLASERSGRLLDGERTPRRGDADRCAGTGGPTDTASPRLQRAEWVQGTLYRGQGDWWQHNVAPQPCLSVVDDGPATIADKDALHAGGNAVVWPQGAAALRILWRRMFGEEP